MGTARFGYARKHPEHPPGSHRHPNSCFSARRPGLPRSDHAQDSRDGEGKIRTPVSYHLAPVVPGRHCQLRPTRLLAVHSFHKLSYLTLSDYSTCFTHSVGSTATP